MKTTVHLDFIVELQPGNYASLDQRLADLIVGIEDNLTGEFNHTVSNVIHSEWVMTVSPE
jgi:hypothetical protein